jgi:peptidyl-prolyl cis-trans isomerase D
VQPQVAAALEQQALTDALVAEAETRLEGAGGDLAALGLTIETEEQLTRTSFGADLPVGMLQRLFTLSDGETSVLAGDGVAYALKLTGISAANPSDETSTQMVSAFTDQAANAIANDLFRALSTDIQNRAGVTIDQATINAIHANFQ